MHRLLFFLFTSQGPIVMKQICSGTWLPTSAARPDPDNGKLSDVIMDHHDKEFNPENDNLS